MLPPFTLVSKIASFLAMTINESLFEERSKLKTHSRQDLITSFTKTYRNPMSNGMNIGDESAISHGLNCETPS